MDVKKFSVSIGVFALASNIIGGIAALTGVCLIVFKAGVDLFGWGDARTVGYLLFCTGLCLVFAGVLLASYVRQR